MNGKTTRTRAPRARGWRIGAWLAGTVALTTTFALMAPVGSAAPVPGGAGMIAYIGEDPSGYQHLFVMSADGTGSIDLDPGYIGIDDTPAWSPDGQLIAFSHGTGFGLGEIATIDPEGTTLTPLTDETGDAGDPSWSPDGTAIVYAVWENDVPQIIKIDADGGNRTPLAGGESPDWSATGTKIVYAKWIKGYSDVFVMNADGSDPRNLTRTRSVSEFSPAWSPDGRTIAFQRSDGDHDIWTMRSDGSSQIRLSRDGTTYFDGFPTYSPDGTRILFVREARVFTMNASGSQPKPVMDEPVPAYATSWQPLACTIEGTDGPDAGLAGTSGDDVICGFGGDDTINGGGGDDTILGGPGNDTASGGLGDDTVVGAGGSDVLSGGDGNDRLSGGAAKDVHRGQGGVDYLFGWDYAGGDRLLGGPGGDRCAYDRTDVVRC